MSEYTATVRWERSGAVFTDNRYSRAHRWTFDGGADIGASASPHVLPPPLSDPAGVDPEEAFVAALSSCHMLWFLSIAAKAGFTVDSYTDDAVGHMERDAEGRMAITRVVLTPQIEFSGEAIPGAERLAELHETAHEKCFIANSVRTHVTTEPVEQAS